MGGDVIPDHLMKADDSEMTQATRCESLELPALYMDGSVGRTPPILSIIEMGKVVVDSFETGLTKPKKAAVVVSNKKKKA